MLDARTEPWGVEVTVVEIKDMALPENLKRAMAKEAEAELVASEKLSEAAEILSAEPVSLQLRTLRTLKGISIEKNSTIVFPVELLTGMKSLFFRAPE